VLALELVKKVAEIEKFSKQIKSRLRA